MKINLHNKSIYVKGPRLQLFITSVRDTYSASVVLFTSYSTISVTSKTNRAWNILFQLLDLASYLVWRKMYDTSRVHGSWFQEYKRADSFIKGTLALITGCLGKSLLFRVSVSKGLRFAPFFLLVISPLQFPLLCGTSVFLPLVILTPFRQC